ncbi:MAG: sulfurtransferase TusA family protein [Candidatus Margulisiibacteriota bacterium]
MQADDKLDCFGLLCPLPIIKTAEQIKRLKVGQVLEVIATDEGIKTDMPAWCKATGQEYLGGEEKDGLYRVFIKKTN